MRVNRLFGVGVVLVLLLVAVSPPVSAQTVVRNTTLAAAVSSGSVNNVTLTSVTNLVVGDVLYLAGWPGEQMQVVSINTTSRVVQVLRGQGGTHGQLHASGQRIWFGQPGPAGPLGGGLQQVAPNVGQSCTRTQFTWTPWIDMTSGIIWTCGTTYWGTNNTWTGSVANLMNFGTTGPDYQ